MQKKYTDDLETQILQQIFNNDIESFKDSFSYFIKTKPDHSSIRELVVDSCLRERWEFIKIMVSMGFGQDIFLNGGDTIMTFSVIKSNIDMVDFLTTNGFDIDGRDDVGYTGLFMAIAACDESMIRHLLSKGADLDADNPDCTPRELMKKKNLSRRFQV